MYDSPVHPATLCTNTKGCDSRKATFGESVYGGSVLSWVGAFNGHWSVQGDF
jgi:hypothetical protein